MAYIVLTGDLVNSSALSRDALDTTLQTIERASSEISQWTQHGRSITIGFARRGGDSWQMAIEDSPYSLRASLFVRACVRALKKGRTTRIAVAKGQGTLPLDRNPNGGHGPAFTASGRLLTELPKGVYMSHAGTPHQTAAFIMADAICEGWTQAQARSIAANLPPTAGSRKDIAQALGISRQAVNQALWSGGYIALEAALSAWETPKAKHVD